MEEIELNFEAYAILCGKKIGEETIHQIPILDFPIIFSRGSINRNKELIEGKDQRQIFCGTNPKIR